jgi:hypothetical protein
MDTIKKLAIPLATPWVWREGSALTAATKLEDAYASFNPAPPQKRSRILYVTVATLTYDGLKQGEVVALPRQVAADVAETAITDIVLREKMGGPHT